MPLNNHSEDGPKSLSDILTLELDMRWCRESGVLAPSADSVPMGAVLAQDADGNYVPFMAELTPEIPEADEVPAAPATYADKAVAVLISKDLPKDEEEQYCSVVRRGVCVATANLQWLDSVTEPQKKTALGQLSALGIVPKE